MTAASETPELEPRVGHYYEMDGTYLVGREKLREYARAVQDYQPAHWDVVAGFGGSVEVRDYPHDDHFSLPQSCVGDGLAWLTKRLG